MNWKDVVIEKGQKLKVVSGRRSGYIFNASEVTKEYVYDRLDCMLHRRTLVHYEGYLNAKKADEEVPFWSPEALPVPPTPAKPTDHQVMVSAIEARLDKANLSYRNLQEERRAIEEKMHKINEEVNYCDQIVQSLGLLEKLNG